MSSSEANDVQKYIKCGEEAKLKSYDDVYCVKCYKELQKDEQRIQQSRNG